MAKHSKKKILFHFIDLDLAEEFLKIIQRKKLYVNVTGQLNPSGKLELTLAGSPENIKITIQKVKKLHKSLLSPESSNSLPDNLEDDDL